MRKLITLGLALGVTLGSYAQTPEVFKQWGDDCFDFIDHHSGRIATNTCTMKTVTEILPLLHGLPVSS